MIFSEIACLVPFSLCKLAIGPSTTPVTTRPTPKHPLLIWRLFIFIRRDMVKSAESRRSLSSGTDRPNNYPKFTMASASSSVVPAMGKVEALNSLRPQHDRSVRFSDSSIRTFTVEENLTFDDSFCSSPRDDDPSLSPPQTPCGRRSPPQPRVHLSLMGYTNRRRRVRRLLAEDMTHRQRQLQVLDDGTSTNCSMDEDSCRPSNN